MPLPLAIFPLSIYTVMTLKLHRKTVTTQEEPGSLITWKASYERDRVNTQFHSTGDRVEQLLLKGAGSQWNEAKT